MKELLKFYSCRICLRRDVCKYLSLFENYEGSSAADHIESIATVEVRKDDGLPGKICPECLLQLGTALAFKRKCEESDKFLHCVTLQEIPKELKKENEIFVQQEVPVQPQDLSHIFDTDNQEKESKTQTVINKSKAVDLKLICDDCQRPFKSKCKLRVHWKNIHLLERLHCKNCKRIFKSFKAYNDHIKQKTRNCLTATKVHIEGHGRNRIFHCKQCPYSSKRIQYLNAHLVTHTGEKPFQCNICLRRFTQSASLNSHIGEIHKDCKVEIPCHKCGKQIKGRHQMQRHLLTHEIGRYQCKICDKILMYRSSLVNHMKRHNTVKDYSCESCPAKFFTLSELHNHKNIVHLKRALYYKHTCDMCSFRSYKAETLIKHESKHNGTNAPCLTCGIFFDNAEKLSQHQKLHSQDRYYGCTLCEKKYAMQQSLNEHMRKKHKIFANKKKAKKKFNVINEKPIKLTSVDNTKNQEAPSILSLNTE